MSSTESTPAPGIAPDLYRRIREALLQCDALQSNATTKALFVEGELVAWRHGAREIDNVQDRVIMLIEFLHDQWADSGQNALVLLLRALSTHSHSGNVLAARLAALATEFAGGDGGWPLPHDPEARLAAMPTDRVPEVARSLPNGSRMPLRPNPLFVGREAELMALARAIKGEGSAAVISQATTVTGIGGIGKTQVGVEWVHRFGVYFAGGVFWLSFAKVESIQDEIAACGRGLSSHPDFSALALDKQVRLVVEAWEQPVPRLLIFDNCEEEDLFTRWRPRTGGCRVLVTSRRARWSPTLGVQQVALGILARAESVTLLTDYRPDLAGQRGLAEIAEEVGDLPLALHLAGSYLATYKGGEFGEPARYLERLRDKGLLNHPSLQGRGITHSPTEHELHVGRTFALSYERLDPRQRVDELAQQLLARAAYFPPGDPILRALLLTTLELGDDEEALLEAEEGLQRLVALGLIEEEVGGSVVLHRLVAMFALGLETNKAVQEVMERLLLHLGDALQSAGKYAVAETLYLRGLELSKARSEPSATIRYQLALGAVAERRGDYRDAMVWLEEAEANSQTPELASERGHVLSQKGYILTLLGNHELAIQTMAEALALAETQQDNALAIKTLLNMGNVFSDRGNYAAAQSCVEKALVQARALDDKVGISRSLTSLANLAYYQSDFISMAHYEEEALAVTRLIGDRRGIAIHLYNLALALASQNDHYRAQERYEQALSIFRELGDRYGIEACLSALGSIAHDLGEDERASALLEEVLASGRAGGNTRSLTNGLLNLTEVRVALGQVAEAGLLAEEGLALAEEMGDKRTMMRAHTLLGRLVWLEGTPALARGHYLTSLRLAQSLGERQYFCENLAALAGLTLAERGALRTSVRLIAVVQTALAQLHAGLSRQNREILDQTLQIARSQLDEATFAAAWAEGEAMSLDEAVALALTEEAPE